MDLKILDCSEWAHYVVKNTVVSSNFLVWKLGENTVFYPQLPMLNIQNAFKWRLRRCRKVFCTFHLIHVSLELAC